MLVLRDCEEPKTFRVADRDSNWQNDMHEEFDALRAHGTWTLEPLPSYRSVIGSKWVYKLKKILMGVYQGSKLGWLLKDILKNMAWIIQRPLVL